MAVEVRAGEAYEASGVRSGDNWTMFRVKAEKGPKELSVFTDGKIDLRDGDSVKVARIVSVRLSARKDRDGNWRDTMSVNAELEVNGTAAKLEDLDDEPDLPF